MITIEKNFIPDFIFPANTFDKEKKLLFFDIETMGFSPAYHPIYLIGCAWQIEGNWKLIQWLAEQKKEENLLLEAFFAFASNFDTLIHFNGNRFDLPFIEKRSKRLNLSFPFAQLKSIDLFPLARKYQTIFGLPNCKQKTVERFLGLIREDEFSGGELISVFEVFCKKHQEEEEKLLLLHNAEDVMGMVSLTAIKFYENYFNSKFTFLQATKDLEQITLSYHTDAFIPKAFHGKTGLFELKGEKKQLELSFSIEELELKHFFADYKNYYYLPEKDTVIHKNTASFLDEPAQKATKKNCYIRHRDFFIPQPELLIRPEFKRNDNSPFLYAIYQAKLIEDEKIASLFLESILKNSNLSK